MSRALVEELAQMGRGALVLREGPNRLLEHLLLFRQSEIHPGSWSLPVQGAEAALGARALPCTHTRLSFDSSMPGAIVGSRGAAAPSGRAGS